VVSVKTTLLRASAGFTMVEILVVIAVLAITMALAGPALSNLAASQQVRTASYDIYSTLTQARSEALTRNTTVTVTPNDGDWARGWTVTEAGGTVLRRQNAYSRLSLSGPVRLVFNGEGRPDSTAVPFALSASDANAETYRCVRLRLNGRSSMSKGACT
jgi:type IV fimbrial biogenesis protein FimT